MMFRRKSQSQRSKSQRRKSQRRKSQCQRRKHNSYKGGNISLASQPFKSLGFGNGASSPREAALFHEQNSNDRQQQLNKMSGGKRSRGKRSSGKRSRSKRSRSKRSRGKRSRSKRSRSKRSSGKRSRGKRSRGKRSRSKRSRSKRSRKQRGGNIEVPSFPPIGGINQAYSATDLSIGGNTSMVAGINDAQGDCFATDTCQSTTGGTKRTKRRKL